LGDGAFWNCTNLVSLTIGSGVQNVGNDVFNGCKKLGSVLMSNGIPSAGYEMFYGCTNLKSVLIPTSVTNILDRAFFITGLTNVVVPDSVKSLGTQVFDGSTNLINITIGNGVTNIGAYAFYGCSSLRNVFFKGNAPSVQNNSFPVSGYIPTAYYLSGTTGWSQFSTTTGIPSAFWNPQIQNGYTSFGVHGNQFGFHITGTADIPIVIEGSTNLAGSSWVTLKLCTLTNSLVYFSDVAWTNLPSRNYRIRSP
jgi:hypothetical protein